MEIKSNQKTSLDTSPSHAWWKNSTLVDASERLSEPEAVVQFRQRLPGATPVLPQLDGSR